MGEEQGWRGQKCLPWEIFRVSPRHCGMEEGTGVSPFGYGVPGVALTAWLCPDKDRDERTVLGLFPNEARGSERAESYPWTRQAKLPWKTCSHLVVMDKDTKV